MLPTINMANRVFQGVTNIIGLFLAMAISVLYANIGCKMVYRLILRRFWSKPSLTSRASRPWWALTTVFYWTVAWLVGSAIPNISDLSNVISSVLVMPMTYVIPPALLVGHWVQSDAMTADYPWRPGMDPYANRTDNWKNLSRWRRGFKPYWYAKLGLVSVQLINKPLTPDAHRYRCHLTHGPRPLVGHHPGPGIICQRGHIGLLVHSASQIVSPPISAAHCILALHMLMSFTPMVHVNVIALH